VLELGSDLRTPPTKEDLVRQRPACDGIIATNGGKPGVAVSKQIQPANRSGKGPRGEETEGEMSLGRIRVVSEIDFRVQWSEYPSETPKSSAVWGGSELCGTFENRISQA